jgi:hypothetical protein
VKIPGPEPMKNTPAPSAPNKIRRPMSVGNLLFKRDLVVIGQKTVTLIYCKEFVA